ncbi:hypothetical protein [Streptomyces sp. NPDC014806]
MPAAAAVFHSLVPHSATALCGRWSTIREPLPSPKSPTYWVVPSEESE